MPDSAGDLSAFCYLVITPVGEHVGTDAGAALITRVVRDVTTVINLMDEKGLLHRQAFKR
jgi:hypothetical protein